MIRCAAILVVLLALGLPSGCGPASEGRNITDITGAMPKLAFHMLRASDGVSVTQDDYRGKVVVLYFGYTQCPDICPATLANLSNVLHRLGSGAARVRVLFVTVDPDRDTLPALKQYVEAFAPQIDGLRGDDDSLTALARRYRVAFGIDRGASGREYNVMHSDAVFFFDPSGRARLVATSTEGVEEIAADVRTLLG